MAVTVTSTTRTADEMRASFGLPPAAPDSESAPAPATTEFSQSIEVAPDAAAIPVADPAPVEDPPAPAADPAPEVKPEEADPEDEEPAPEPPKPGEPRKVSRAQQRVNDALRERYLAEGRAAQLQAELDALKAPKPPVAEPAHDTPAPPDGSDPRPEEDDFSDWSEYQLKLAEWAGREAARDFIAKERQKDAEEKAREAATTARQRAVEAYQAKAAEARQTYPDFDTVVGQSTLPLDDTGIMRHAILTSEVGPDLAYYLGSHPEVCAELASATPDTILTRLHRLEGRFEAQRELASTTPRPAASRIPTAPPPPPAVRVGSSVQLPTTRTAKTFKEFEEAERREAEARAKTRT